MRFSAFALTMWASLLALIFAFLATVLADAVLLTILNGVFLGITVAVIIVYSPLVYYTFRKGQLDRVSQLSLGIGLIWLSIAAQRVWRIVWDNNGNPTEYASHWSLAATVFVAIIGGSLFVTAPGFPSDISKAPVEVWGANRRILIVFGALGGVATFLGSLHTGNII